MNPFAPQYLHALIGLTKPQAHEILNAVAGGLDVPDQLVTAALVVTGDLNGILQT